MVAGQVRRLAKFEVLQGYGGGKGLGQASKCVKREVGHVKTQVAHGQG